jgi:thioesterase domain-containing protein
MARILVGQGQAVSTLALMDTFNFARKHWTGASIARKLRQRALFHFGNLRQVPFRDWRAYITVKLRIVREGEFSIMLNNVRNGLGGSDASDVPSSAKGVQMINQRAALRYQPKPYPGILTLINPRVNYSYYKAPAMGWEGLVTGKIETVVLPMNPHAMLVEPFVRELAAALVAKLVTVPEA